MASRSTAAGWAFILIGAISVATINLADWLLPGRSIGIGLPQLLASIPPLLTIWAGALLRRRHPIHATTPRHGLTLLVGGLTGFCSVALALLATDTLQFDKGSHFRYDSTTGIRKAYRNVVQTAGWSGARICRCAPDKTARIALPGGFHTQIAIYDKGGEAPRPGVVFAHGNVWMGSDLSTYRLLASGLAQHGVIVLTVDSPGFGKADDPFSRGPSGLANASDTVGTLNAAIDYLIASTNVDPSNIVVFGHSGGVDWAMRTAVINPKVSGVAVMVAPSPATFKDTGQGTAEYEAARGEYFAKRFEEQYRFVYGKDVPEWNRWELTELDVKYPDDIWRAYQAAGHKPFLLILGERDEPTGHASVYRDFASVAAPKSLIFVRRSNHYLNTAQSLGFVFYDADVAAQIAREFSAWIYGRNVRE